MTARVEWSWIDEATDAPFELLTPRMLGARTPPPPPAHLVRGRASPTMVRLDVQRRPSLVHWTWTNLFGPWRWMARLSPWRQLPVPCRQAACRRSHMRWLNGLRYHYAAHSLGITFQ